MESITSYLTKDHEFCDNIFSEAEEAANNKDWDLTASKTTAFLKAMDEHLTMEEEVLFPTFEEATGMTMGPTQVMRSEHVQMRDLFEQMGTAVKNQDQDGYLGTTETLLILMQQHNMKEQEMLYPMSDQHLDDQASEVVSKMSVYKK